jgi:hypothetical protein
MPIAKWTAPRKVIQGGATKMLARPNMVDHKSQFGKGLRKSAVFAASFGTLLHLFPQRRGDAFHQNSRCGRVSFERASGFGFQHDKKRVGHQKPIQLMGLFLRESAQLCLMRERLAPFFFGFAEAPRRGSRMLPKISVLLAIAERS